MTETNFSLLLPVYAGDKPEYLEKAFLSSTAEQTLRPSEAIIVRDGPVGAELERLMDALAAESPIPTRVVRIKENTGLARALERGLDECAHDVVARMDADDISLPERFEKQLEKIRDGFDLVGSGMLEFAETHGAVLARRVPPTDPAAIVRYSRFHDPFNHPTVVYRRSAVRAAGGYRDLGLMEDYWLFARMIQSGASVINLADPLVMYRVGDGAYARRGGFGQFVAELRLQREFRRSGFTTRWQAARNVALRAPYRLVPQAVRRAAYRRVLARSVE
ncbi:glycosyltransferase [Herbiconiux sp. SYSU D00978]|uniref:glycosyltransferase n=1 Tax=Herbiconiux sp. SYSU D00978 TaxID=2812562 RepID=UPI001A9621DD|nr:glycosyltransferase [Herbiconiux sp. SYSU D00978]